MKKLIVGCIIAIGLFVPKILPAQGVVYLSNVAQSSAGSEAVASNSWLATDFHTGTNAGGYLLNFVQLALTDASGTPSGFTAMIYSATGGASVSPGSSLGTLNGSSNPATGGIFAYIPASSITLSPSTDYFVVLTAGTAIASGAYEWSYAGVNSYSPNGGWNSEGGAFFISSNGSHWNSGTSVGPEYTITATAIPEPGAFSLFALGGLGFLWQHRKAKALK